jgi:hypothetical protein
MAAKAATAVAPVADRFGGMDFEAVLDDSLIKHGLETGGQLSAEDRMSGSSSSFPVYAVVGKGASDVEVWNETVGANISRAGQFRFKRGSELIEDGYRKVISPVVILHAVTGHVAFDSDGKPICRGISTRGMYDSVCTGGKFQAVGFKCDDCELSRWRKNQINPFTGQPVTDEEKCKNNLELYCWDPQADPEGSDIFKVQFSASSFDPWRKWSAAIEQRGVKLWSLWFGIRAKHNKGEGNKSDYYTPEFAAGPAAHQLTAQEVSKAEELRARLQGELLAPLNIVPVLAIASGPGQSALPSGPVGISASEDVFENA